MFDRSKEKKTSDISFYLKAREDVMMLIRFARFSFFTCLSLSLHRLMQTYRCSITYSPSYREKSVASVPLAIKQFRQDR